MGDFFEIDFLHLGSSKSGDAIALRYEINGITTIHVIDGGFQDTGEKIIEHINRYYDSPSRIDRVVVSHSDGDHTGGLRAILEEFDIRELWMLRPWLYADKIIDRFRRFSSVKNLKRRLRDIYPNITALEEIAEKNDIPIYEPFQGAKIGEFKVMAPKKKRYLDLVVKSEKTPESAGSARESTQTSAFLLQGISAVIENTVRAAWGKEFFSSEDTSAENEMSVVQYANLCGEHILLTADAGRAALTEAADYAPSIRLELPGIDRFQIPHHGSRRNVSSQILDRWLGPQLRMKTEEGKERFTAIVSAAKDDKNHPRKAVVRACIHRGGKVLSTESASLQIRHNAPQRKGWSTATPLSYPQEQEE